MNNKKSIDIAFVILHYLVDEETVKCISAISENVDTVNYHIIVVDNASNNGSYERLVKKYENNAHVSLIHNTENIGFAKGNNVGIDYVKEHYEFRYICCLNNDVYLMDKHLIDTLDEEYKKSNFAVLGPLILSGDGRYDSNPQTVGIITDVADVHARIKRYKRLLLLLKLHLYGVFVRLKTLRNTYTNNTAKKIIPQRQLNVQLSGACLIFTNYFFEKLNGFCPETFLYKEEDILRYQLMQNKLLSVFLPTLLFYHAEDASTDAQIRNSREKDIFVYKEYIKSLNVLLKIMKNEN